VAHESSEPFSGGEIGGAYGAYENFLHDATAYALEAISSQSNRYDHLLLYPNNSEVYGSFDRPPNLHNRYPFHSQKLVIKFFVLQTEYGLF